MAKRYGRRGGGHGHLPTFVLLAVFVFSALQLVTGLREYDQARSAYEEIRGAYRAKAPDGPEVPGAPAPLYDYEGLRRVNGEFAGMIGIPALDLSYPFVQASDNAKYLNRLFTGETNAGGCIFMDAAADPDLTDFNTFLFGHNMKDGTMFGRLQHLPRALSEGEDPHICLYTEGDGREKVRRYRVFACGRVQSDDPAIYGDADFSGEEARDSFLEAVSGICLEGVQRPVPGDGRRLITLSTCFDRAHVWSYIVVGVLEEDG